MDFRSLEKVVRSCEKGPFTLSSLWRTQAEVRCRSGMQREKDTRPYPELPPSEPVGLSLNGTLCLTRLSLPSFPRRLLKTPPSSHTVATRPEISLSLRAPETRVTGRSGHRDPSGNGKETKRNRADLSKREEMTTFCTSLVQGDEREMETENSVEIL